MKFPTKYVDDQGFNQVLHIRNKYHNSLDMNNTGGNVIWRKLTNVLAALKNLQIKARGKVRSSWNQDCGPETQISGSCTSSRHPKFFAVAPERFGSLKTKTHYTICIIGLLQNMSAEWELKFQAPAPSFKSFWLGLWAPAPQSWLEPTVFGNE